MQGRRLAGAAAQVPLSLLLLLDHRLNPAVRIEHSPPLVNLIGEELEMRSRK